LRNAWGTSVVRMSDGDLRRARSMLDAAGMRVGAIGSPLGKTRLEDGWEVVAEQLRACVRACEALDTRLVRVFSFFVDPGRDGALRNQVLDRMGRMAAVAESAGLMLVHENEKGIYGDTPERCVDLLDAVASPALAACFDVANFIQVGVRDVRGAWDLLAPRVRHVHVKDALADGTVQPAGQGLGEWAYLVERLVATGYEGLLSLEPHLDGVVPGSGCQRLGVAATGLRAVLGAGATAPAG
jgi:sugar phosphate isomerase/epimerase